MWYDWKEKSLCEESLCWISNHSDCSVLHVSLTTIGVRNLVGTVEVTCCSISLIIWKHFCLITSLLNVQFNKQLPILMILDLLIVFCTIYFTKTSAEFPVYLSVPSYQLGKSKDCAFLTNTVYSVISELQGTEKFCSDNPELDLAEYTALTLWVVRQARSWIRNMKIYACFYLQ